MIQYDRLSGAFVLQDELRSEIDLGMCAKLNEAMTEVRAWLNLKRRSGRYSHGFLAEMAVHSLDRKYDVHAVYDEIGILEGTDPRPSLTKKPRRMRPPLRRLWHKHYFQGGFIPRNLIDEAERMVQDGRWEKMFAPHYGRYVSEVVNQTAHEMVFGAYERRAQDRRLTGEFIVYEKQQDGSHYYLTLGSHGEWDAIRARVDNYKKFDSDGDW